MPKVDSSIGARGRDRTTSDGSDRVSVAAQPSTSSTSRPLGGRRGRALGAVAAQASQALASFALQVLAARLLGVEGLGRFAALYGFLILATAICSGFVGDSLTVLDRPKPSIRAGLEWWLLVLSSIAGLLACLGSWAFGFVDWGTALAFGGATTVFLLEDILRRTLMANLLFWRIVVVDLTSLVVSVTVIVLAGGGSLTLFMLALLVGQTGALIMAILLLPSAERWLARPWPAAIGAVAAYGSWRAIQQAVRPALLAAVRVVSIVLVGIAATGELEAARIYMAPALLVVGGVSSFLFASYAIDRGVALAESVRRADRSVLGLLGAVAALGTIAVLLLPVVGPLLTGDDFALSLPAVVGWAAYAASVAAVTPYGSLAAVRGRQAAVLAWRVSDSVLSLGMVAVLLAVTRSIAWAPAVLAVGSLLGGLAIRQFVLKREAARQLVNS